MNHTRTKLLDLFVEARSVDSLTISWVEIGQFILRKFIKSSLEVFFWLERFWRYHQILETSFFESELLNLDRRVFTWEKRAKLFIVLTVLWAFWKLRIITVVDLSFERKISESFLSGLSNWRVFQEWSLKKRATLLCHSLFKLCCFYWVLNLSQIDRWFNLSDARYWKFVVLSNLFNVAEPSNRRFIWLVRFLLLSGFLFKKFYDCWSLIRDSLSKDTNGWGFKSMAFAWEVLGS